MPVIWTMDEPGKEFKLEKPFCKNSCFTLAWLVSPEPTIKFDSDVVSSPNGTFITWEEFISSGVSTLSWIWGRLVATCQTRYSIQRYQGGVWQSTHFKRARCWRLWTRQWERKHCRADNLACFNLACKSYCWQSTGWMLGPVWKSNYCKPVKAWFANLQGSMRVGHWAASSCAHSFSEPLSRVPRSRLSGTEWLIQ